MSIALIAQSGCQMEQGGPGGKGGGGGPEQVGLKEVVGACCCCSLCCCSVVLHGHVVACPAVRVFAHFLFVAGPCYELLMSILPPTKPTTSLLGAAAVPLCSCCDSIWKFLNHTSLSAAKPQQGACRLLGLQSPQLSQSRSHQHSVHVANRHMHAFEFLCLACAPERPSRWGRRPPGVLHPMSLWLWCGSLSFAGLLLL
jgi:hypothetical protein